MRPIITLAGPARRAGPTVAQVAGVAPALPAVTAPSRARSLRPARRGPGKAATAAGAVAARGRTLNPATGAALGKTLDP